MIRASTIRPLIGLLALSACGARENTSSGPDEFSVLPARALEMPSDFSSLPEPTPGAANLTDPNPQGAAVSALGGRANLVQTSSGSVSDSALLLSISATGADGALSLLTSSGRGKTLDAYAEWLRLQNAGISVPPPPSG